MVPDGIYSVRMAPRDVAGNVGARVEQEVGVYTALSAVATSLAVFYPQDGDRLSPYTSLSFALSKPATVTWVVKSSSGTLVRTVYDAAALAAGTHTLRWYGTDDAGVRLPGGAYVSSVRATDGTLAITQTVSVQMAPFAIKSSDATPARGQTVTIYATSGESLSKMPRLSVFQPGIGSWSVAMSHTTGRVYKATIRFKSSSTGQVKLRVGGYDLDGNYQKSYLYLPLH
jgi:hypothetical protein